MHRPHLPLPYVHPPHLPLPYVHSPPCCLTCTPLPSPCPNCPPLPGERVALAKVDAFADGVAVKQVCYAALLHDDTWHDGWGAWGTMMAHAMGEGGLTPSMMTHATGGGHGVLSPLGSAVYISVSLHL